ncbi:hypothetical protein GWK47_045947 [Chionoecetes opilio]|uniref:Uncharacterized protein n=1 Tax=Chionoecetes opilio TaxID=41210 RepID=A0A8J4Y6V5_CHIOP|nr:hypothetical protein GWK47_045947 [Chionoecetes opilio]
MVEGRRLGQEDHLASTVTGILTPPRPWQPLMQLLNGYCLEASVREMLPRPSLGSSRPWMHLYRRGPWAGVASSPIFTDELFADHRRLVLDVVAQDLVKVARTYLRDGPVEGACLIGPPEC